MSTPQSPLQNVCEIARWACTEVCKPDRKLGYVHPPPLCFHFSHPRNHPPYKQTRVVKFRSYGPFELEGGPVRGFFQGSQLGNQLFWGPLFNTFFSF